MSRLLVFHCPGPISPGYGWTWWWHMWWHKWWHKWWHMWRHMVHLDVALDFAGWSRFPTLPHTKFTQPMVYHAFRIQIRGLASSTQDLDVISLSPSLAQVLCQNLWRTNAVNKLIFVHQ